MDTDQKTDFRRLLQFEIGLKQLSMTALIAHVYEQPDIKEKLKESIRSNYIMKSFPYKPIKKDIIKLASKKINALNLPNSLITEVQGLLIFFAKKIVSWAEVVIKDLKLDMSYLDRIYWTSLGTIDDAKIFYTYWEKHKDFSKIQKDNATKKPAASVMACKYPKEEIILHLQDSMINEVQAFLKKVKLPDIKNKTEQIVATYMCYLYGRKHDEEDVYNNFKKTGNVNIRKIMPLCKGSPRCIEFLWNFIDEADKLEYEVAYGNAFENVRHALDSCNSLYHEQAGLRTDIETDVELEMIKLQGTAEAIHFLLKQIPEEHKESFMDHNAGEIMETFLQVWPYPYLCLKLLDEKWFSKAISENSEEAFYTLLIRMAKDFNDLAFVTGKCHYPSVFHELLQKMLSIVPQEKKQTVLFASAYHCAANKEFAFALETFWFIFDLTALSLIINDKDLKHKRDDMIKMGSEKIVKLMQKRNLKPIVNFMERVLVTNEERKNFIKKWKLEKYAALVGNEEIRQKISAWVKS